MPTDPGLGQTHVTRSRGELTVLLVKIITRRLKILPQACMWGGCGAHQCKRFERLCRYITRRAIASERLERDGALIYVKVGAIDAPFMPLPI